MLFLLDVHDTTHVGWMTS